MFLYNPFLDASIEVEYKLHFGDEVRNFTLKTLFSYVRKQLWKLSKASGIAHVLYVKSVLKIVFACARRNPRQ